ncbi:MAG TPA: hypothetical protein GXZ76_01610 [Clostridiaceae bacterium]|nr:hypothetical protein [Clostridiaceae bacterium]
MTFTNFLDYRFYQNKEGIKLCTIEKSFKKLKNKFRNLTGLSNGMGIEKRKSRLNALIRGWVSYFK